MAFRPDGERHLLRIAQGKGAKDRPVTLTAALLDRLRDYWRRYLPAYWLFPSSPDPQGHLNISAAQRIFSRAKAKSGVDRIGGIHSLRHALAHAHATHPPEHGLPVRVLQRRPRSPALSVPGVPIRATPARRATCPGTHSTSPAGAATMIRP